MTAVTFFAASNAISALFFLSDATPFARLRAAVFRKDRFPHQTVCNFRKAGDFAEPFSPPLRGFTFSGEAALLLFAQFC